MRVYKTDSGRTLSGVCIRIKIRLEKSRPAAAASSPAAIPKATEVWTTRRRPLKLRAPRQREARTFVPMLNPIRKFVSRLIRVVVDPTAAKECVDPKFPTTAISDALNNSCKTLDAIKGRANSNMDGSSALFVISIFLVFTSMGYPSGFREYSPEPRPCIVLKKNFPFFEETTSFLKKIKKLYSLPGRQILQGKRS